MNSFFFILLSVFLFATLVSLMFGLLSLIKEGNSNISNNLMKSRVTFHAIVIFLLIILMVSSNG